MDSDPWLLARIWDCIRTWADANHDPIEALAALVSAAFAIILTASTIGLWIVTGTAAKAARAASEALPILERAYLFFVEVTDIGFEFESVAGQRVCIPRGGGVAFTVVNSGKTPAIITEVKGKAASLPTGTGMPDPIDATNERGMRLPNISVGSNKSREFHCLPDPDFRTPNVDMLAVETGDQRLFLLGYVRYTDIFRKRHRTGFCLEYVASAKVFSMHGEGDYNYSTDED